MLGLSLPEVLAVVQIVSLLGGLIWMYQAQRADIRVIRHDLLKLEEAQRTLNEAFRQLGKILTQVAVQDNRLIMLEKAIDEMRHGQGFVKN